MFRKIIKKLNNFRFASICMAICSGVAAFYAVLSLIFYHFAGDLDDKGIIRTTGFSSEKFVQTDEYGTVLEGGNIGLYLGFILFVFIVVTIVLGVMVAYSCVPYIKNKDKLTPRKGLLITGFVGSIFELGVIVLMLLLVLSEHTNTAVGIWLTLPFGVLSMLGSCFYLVAYLNCEFYMPEISKK